MKTISRVSHHNIRRNIKSESNDLVLTCKANKDNRYRHTAIVRDKDGNEVDRFIYRKDKPLSYGARGWFEIQFNWMWK